MRAGLTRSAGIVLALAAASCAKRAPQTPLLFVCGGELSYPPPSAETCAPGEGPLARLTVTTVDSMGAVLPAKIVLTPAAGPADAKTVMGDAQGVAALEAEPGLYAVTVVAAGFVPQARPLKLSAGCSGRETFRLAVVQ